MTADDKANLTINQRMRKLGLGIGQMCMEMEKRGMLVRYVDVAAAFHGEPAWDTRAREAVLRTLEILEQEARQKHDHGRD